MIGKVTSVEMNMNRDYGAFYPRLPFLLQPGAGCGMDIGPYFISCAAYLLGPVAEVTGFADVSRPYRREDCIFGMKTALWRRCGFAAAYWEPCI